MHAAPIAVHSARKVGCEPTCLVCGAHCTISTSWKQVVAERPDTFVALKALRWGTLFQCRSCAQPWYLDGSEQFIHYVPRDRLPLIEQWNHAPIRLSAEVVSKLVEFGRTPPANFTWGLQYHETPCAVLAHDGERIDPAMVSIQKHAPFERYRTCRLASEIADVSPSTFALPLRVRVATSQAREIAMGSWPTVVALSRHQWWLPTKKLLMLNGINSFLDLPGYRASEAELSSVVLDKRKWKRWPEFYPGPKALTYFIADGD
jgi:hypothetical protein